MTVDQARREEIAAKIRNGRPQAEIAAEYGVSVRTIGRIRRQTQADAEALAALSPAELRRRELSEAAERAHQLVIAAIAAADPTDLAAVRAVAPLLSAAVHAAEAAIRLAPAEAAVQIHLHIGDRPPADEGDGWKVMSITPDYDPAADQPLEGEGK